MARAISEAPVIRAIRSGSDGEIFASNTEGTALASAARTATTTSATLSNPNARGVMAFVNITAASGTGGLQLRIQAIDPISGGFVNLNSAPTALVAIATAGYAVYPGIAVTAGQYTSAALPASWRISVTHGDASSYTYSVGYSLIY